MTQLVASGSATTNPAPNTLATPNPYANATADRQTAQPAWVTQAKQALLSKVAGDAVQGKIRLDFNPSSSTATYTVTLWTLNRLTGTWYQPATNASATFTGPVSTYLENAGNDAWFVQLSSISTGTVQVMYDGRYMKAL